MFRRAFWFTTGAAAGVWATNKVHRKIRSLAPDALALRAADKAVETGHRIKDFALDVRAGMSQRENELNEVLGLHAPVDPHHTDHPELLPPQARKTELGTAYPYDRKEDH